MVLYNLFPRPQEDSNNGNENKVKRYENVRRFYKNCNLNALESYSMQHRKQT